MAASDSEFVTALATDPAEHAATPCTTSWFTSVEEQIERSKSHWSELVPFDSEFDEDMDEDAVIADNFQVFKHLQMHPIWGHFFQTVGDGEFMEDLVVGEKFAEGGQAEIYHAKVKWNDKLSLDAYEMILGCAFALKVFKKGTLLRQLQAQWPHGLFLHHDEKMERRRVGKVAGIRYYSDILYGILLGDGRFAFLMVKEYGDLRSYIDRQCVLTTSQEPIPIENGEAQMIMYFIALGMDWLHNRNIIHRDLKSSNVLLNYFNHSQVLKACYIADYECSIGVVGTGFFKAPEILQVCKDGNVRSRPEVFTKAADVYSYGMTCYEILTGKLPFEGHSHRDYDLVLEGQRPKVPAYVDDWMQELLNSCWQSNPEARPTFAEILNLFEVNSAVARKARFDAMIIMATERIVLRRIVLGERLNGDFDPLLEHTHFGFELDGQFLTLPFGDIAFAMRLTFAMTATFAISKRAIPTFGTVLAMLPLDSRLRRLISESISRQLQNEDVPPGFVKTIHALDVNFLG